MLVDIINKRKWNVMEITRLKWPANHKILPDLDIKLTDAAGKPYKTIIIAGDNGLGKTTILNAINNIISGISCDFESFEYKIGDNSYIATQKDKEHIQVKKADGEFHDVQLHNRPNKSLLDFGEIGEMDDFSPQKFKSILSSASTEFSTSSTGDTEYYLIKQFLITLERQDNEEYRARNTALESSGKSLLSISDFNSRFSKLEKFKNTFNKVFDVLKFNGIKSDIDSTSAIFTKGSNDDIDIDQLSTGEKQIVFRGSYILSRAQNVDVVMIDEPEISMHPSWMKKILQYYQDLITDKTTGEQKSQLFISTHSDLLIKKAAEAGNILIIRLTKNGNSLLSNNPDDMVLPSLTSAEINYAVFGISSIDYHIQLFSQLHSNIIINDSNKGRITSADESIKGQSLYNHQYSRIYEHVHDNGHITIYETLPCFIRNCIDHPGSPDSHGNIQNFSERELEESIKFLRDLIIEQNLGRYDYTK